MIGLITLSGGSWVWPVAGFLALAGAVLFWSYRSAPPGALRWGCLALKAGALLALGLCLLEPLWFGQRARPGQNLFAILADNSRSLQVRDSGSAESRGRTLLGLLDPARAGWLAELGDTFEVRRYLFDSRLQATADFHELDFSGRATALGGALRALAERFRGRPLAGILLLTDGDATDARGGPIDLAGVPPVYPVPIGRSEPVRDIAVERVDSSQSAFEDAPVTVQADVSAAGYEGLPIVARLTDQAGAVVQEQTQTAGGSGDHLAFRFRFKPDRAGLLFYSVSAGLAPGSAAAPEATLANNRRVVVVDRGGGPYRVLYVGGHPGWEYKFINRAVQEDRQVDLVGLIRIARSEPKFDFRGRVGETSNPLYRGFSNQAPEEVQRYDQPVLIRLNTRDGLELRSGFPSVAEDLYGYDAVIADDVEAGFFSPVQALLLQKFVSERGGGFLMLGGMQSFREGGYDRNPIGDMLPVYLDGLAGSPVPPEAGLRLELTREGLLEPWARLRDNEAEERARREALPAFHVANWVRGIKPGASLVAVLRDPAGAEIPALAVQRFGRGRTAALTVGDFWRWGLSDPANDSDMEKSWRQLVRWLVSDVPRRVELNIEPVPGDPNGAVRLEVRARDPRYQPMDDAAVSLEVSPVLSEGTEGALAKPIRIEAEPSLAEAGLYEATYVPRLTGGYRASAAVSNAAGVEVGRADAGWSTDLDADEFQSLQPNLPLLEEVARRTGGRVVAAADLPSFVRQLPSLRAPEMEAWSFPLWHTPEMFAFALACLLAEWGLRRWKGLA